MRRGLRGVTAAALLASLLWPEDASAERRKRQRERDDEDRAEGYDDWRPYASRDEIDLQAWWWSAGAPEATGPFAPPSFGSTFAFAMHGQGVPSEGVAVGFWLPWTFNVRPVGDPIAGLGNLTIDVHAFDTVGIVTWHAGGGVSLPLASIEDDSGAYRVATILGGTTLALYDSFLFLPAFFPVRGYGGVELRLTRGVSLRAGIDPIFLPPLEGQDFEIVLQEHVDLIALADPGIGGGLRLQGAHPLLDGDDRAQMSIEPYVAFDDGETFFAKVGLLMALDEQLGFAFDPGKVLALHLTVGGQTGDRDNADRW